MIEALVKIGVLVLIWLVVGLLGVAIRLLLKELNDDDF